MSLNVHRRLLAATGALALGASLLGGSAATAAGPETVATGLNSPRQLAFSPGGTLYVAEAGPFLTPDDSCVQHPEFGTTCAGLTGSLAKISGGTVDRVVTGLPSLSSAAESVGPFDLVFTGNNTVAFTIGLGGSPAIRDSFGKDGTHLGYVGSATLNPNHKKGVVTYEFDTVAHEAAHDIDADVDSNPTGLARSGNGYVVADSGGNTLVSTRKGGSTLAEFAPVATTQPGPVPVGFPADAVPTDVVQGKDGSWYVSQLVGFPFEKGSSTIWRVPAGGGTPTPYATGLTNVTSLDIASDGTLYAVELASDGLLSGPVGSLRKIVPGGSSHPLVAGGLNQPYGLAIDGSWAYVTTGTIAAATGGGSVVRIRL